MRRVVLLLATAFGIGHLPLAPATWASLTVAILVAIAPGFLDPVPLGAALVLLVAIGIPVAGSAERILGRDASPIVIDEIAGMCVALWGIGTAERPPWLFLLLAFVLFRVFDIWKPWLIRRAQDLVGGMGVMADDVAAGIATNLVLRAAAAAGVPF